MTPTCNHTPRDQVAAFFHVCRDCGLPIEPELCEACDGHGRVSHPLERDNGEECAACKGTGVERWKATLL